MIKKTYPRMVCVVCHRPMTRAAALQGGYPVGPVCAAKLGLVKPAATEPVQRDTRTIDLFAS